MNSKEKQIKTSENNYKMTKLDKTKQESFEKKRNTSKTKLSKEISKQSRNNSDFLKYSKSQIKTKFNKNINNISSSSPNINTNSTPKRQDHYRKQSRNENNGQKPRPDEYNLLIGEYINKKNDLDTKDFNQSKHGLNISVNLSNNYLKSNHKINDFYSPKLNNSGIFRTQNIINKSNVSLYTKTHNNLNDQSLNRKHLFDDYTKKSKNGNSYKLNDKLHNRMGILNESKENIKYDQLHEMHNLSNCEEMQNSQYASPFKSNEFTFDKTFGKNSEISKKLMIANNLHNQEINTNENGNNWNAISAFNNNASCKSKFATQTKSNIVKINESLNKSKEKPLKFDTPIKLEFNNSTKHINVKAFTKNDESCADYEKLKKSTSKLKNDIQNVKKVKEEHNKSFDFKSNNNSNEKTLIKKQKDSFKNNDHNNSYLISENQQPSSISKSNLLSNKNSVFTSVNSGYYAQTKISTNESKSLLVSKVSDPESIEEMHYLLNKFCQKSKQMIIIQENHNISKNKTFMYKTVMLVDEVEIE